jgi:RNA polymerase sigma-70 factor (ECF subfamily)
VSVQIGDALVDRLFRLARAEQWGLQAGAWAESLGVSASRAFGAKTPGSHELQRYLEALHLEDLAVACACAAGIETAWEHFVREHRPVLYRAADAIDPSGGARELADSLYADLYGLRDRSGQRASLFRYFHGRSSLATWLRAVLAQRHVDRLRERRRVEPLPDEESSGAIAASLVTRHPDRPRYVARMRQALGRAVARLAVRDRLRLGCYYAQELTLAEIGRLLREHEATASRHLARTRRAIREDIERQLRAEAKMSDAEMALCFESVMEDSGSIDLAEMLEVGGPRKESGSGRSTELNKRRTP